MKEVILEKNEIPVLGGYDVIVAGGGIAGVSAALAAKRMGRSVLIIEKSIYFGGLATLGLITYYEPMCDGKGRKIIGGIAEELLHISIKYGYNSLPDEWKDGKDYVNTTKRYATAFSPSLFVLALDEIIEKEKIDILLDTLFCSTVTEDGVCRGIIVENKSGRGYYNAKMVVDTTGDCDVMANIGTECSEVDNYLTYCAYETNLERMKKAVETGNIMYGVRCVVSGANRLGGNAPVGSRKYIGTDSKEVTSFVLDGRKLVRERFNDENNNERDLLMIPSMPQFRTTRRINGLYELNENDKFKHFEDSIGCICDFSKPGPIYEIPYRSLISRNIRNVITAGRTIASFGHAWEVTRVIPAASLTGQAAGTAAALAVNKGLDLQEVPVDELQFTLGSTGIMIHF